jgi:hypothetical protein
MGVPTSEVGYTTAMPRREDHEVHKDMWWYWIKKKLLLYFVSLHEIWRVIHIQGWNASVLRPWRHGHSENDLSELQHDTVRCQSSTCELKDGGLLAVCEPSVELLNFLNVRLFPVTTRKFTKDADDPILCLSSTFKYKLASSNLNYANSFYIKPKLDTHAHARIYYVKRQITIKSKIS